MAKTDPIVNAKIIKSATLLDMTGMHSLNPKPYSVGVRFSVERSTSYDHDLRTRLEKPRTFQNRQPPLGKSISLGTVKAPCP